MAIDICIGTCSRMPQYVDETLRLMIERDEGGHVEARARVFIDGPSAFFTAPDGVGLLPYDPDRWRDVVRLDPKERVSRNFLRMLEASDGNVILLQDDLDFAPNWLSRATEIAQLVSREQNLFVLALYAPYPLVGTPVAPYRKTDFYGNQALYISDAARVELIAFFEKATRLEPDDMMVKAYLEQSEAQLYAANPSLVQHVGMLSAVEDRFHISPTFEEAFG